MTASRMICLTGYHQGGECAHCGRELKHCVETDAGIVGAACFVKLTKAPTYQGRKYRLTTDAVISLAKNARSAKFCADYGRNLIFEAA